MLAILAWIVFGLIVGLIAKAVMPGRDPGGLIVTILLGIVGSIIGGFIGRALGYGRPGDFAGSATRPGLLVNLALAVLGAIIVLAVYRLIARRRLKL